MALKLNGRLAESKRSSIHFHNRKNDVMDTIDRGSVNNAIIEEGFAYLVVLVFFFAGQDIFLEVHLATMCKLGGGVKRDSISTNFTTSLCIGQ